MLDHILLDIAGAIRATMENAMLERSSIEERFQVDVWLGDISFETSYSLPGEANPPKVRADLSFEWPTWSQSAYRSWAIGESEGDKPEFTLQLALRIQRLSERPDMADISGTAPLSSPVMLEGIIELTSISVEESLEMEEGNTECAVEFLYESSFHLSDPILEDPSKLEGELKPLGTWLASVLVKLADLPLSYLPPDENEE